MEKEIIENLIAKNEDLKKELLQLKNRLRWIASLSKGLIENDLAQKVCEGRQKNGKEK